MSKEVNTPFGDGSSHTITGNTMTVEHLLMAQNLISKIRAPFTTKRMLIREKRPVVNALNDPLILKALRCDTLEQAL